mmetsp:Transcript_28285/g.93896  ORF Transcript_28285/g.93896 Transcript_28285/m.93896 type:complete len:429 (+) Transcript_28285:314-1600(+)
MAIPRGKHHCVGVRTTRGSASPWALKRTSPNRSCAPRGASYGNPKHCNNQCMPELWQLLWLLLRTVQIRHPQEMRNESRNEREGISTNLAECALLGCLLAAHLGRLNLLCRGRKVHPHAVHEEGGLPLVRHIWVHDGAVLVALNVGGKALVRVRPTHRADLVALHWPVCLPVEGFPELLHAPRGTAVDKGIAQTRARAEVHWEIDQVVQPEEAFLVEHMQKHIPGQCVRQVPEHHRGTPITSRLYLQTVAGDGVCSRNFFTAGRGLRTRPLYRPHALHSAELRVVSARHEHPRHLVLLPSGRQHPLLHVLEERAVRRGLGFEDRVKHGRLGPNRQPADWRASHAWSLLRGRARGRDQARALQEFGVREGMAAAGLRVGNVGLKFRELEKSVLDDEAHLRSDAHGCEVRSEVLQQKNKGRTLLADFGEH